MYLICPRSLRVYFPLGLKSKPVKWQTAQEPLVGNKATLQVAKSQDTLTLTFCFGSSTQKDHPCISSLHSVSYQTGLKCHIQEVSLSPQVGSDLCSVPPWPLELLPSRGPQLPALPLSTHWLVFHPMMVL